jgi:hypothetical protein
MLKGLKRGELNTIEMRTCLSSFSDFFKDLACVPHDSVKNVEETTAPSADTAALNEVKKEDSPTNTLVENGAVDEVEDIDSVYEDKSTGYKHRKSTTLETCIILAPLILGLFYSYVMTSLIYGRG